MSSVAATDPRAAGARTGVAAGSCPAGGRVGPLSPVLVVGLGNPILGDDGVGWKVIDALESRLRREAAQFGLVELDRMAVGGLALMERLVGCERAIVVDAVLGPGRPGAIRCGPLDEIVTRRASHLDSAHDTGLVQALRAGRALGACLPDDVTVLGIVVRRVDVFDERLSPPVAGAVDKAAAIIVGLLTAPGEGAG